MSKVPPFDKDVDLEVRTRPSPLLDGLRRFAAAGMTYAIVGVDVDNPGAEALYRSVGFRPDRVLRGYERR